MNTCFVAQRKSEINQNGLSPSACALISAAQALNIPCARLDESPLLCFGHGKKQRHSWGALPANTGAIAYNVADDRILLAQLLKAAGIPVAASFLIETLDSAWLIAQEMGLPVVVKRRYAGYAKGAYLNLQTQAEIESAYLQTKEDEYSVMLEPFVQGQTYHFLMMHGQLVAASCQQGDAVIDVKTQVHFENIRYAALAAKIVGLKIAHIVMVAEDISRGLRVQGGKIIGINPELNLLHWQFIKSHNPAAEALIKDFFPEEQDDASRIPIFSVLGSVGQNLTARLLQHIFLQQKYDVGLACQQGMLWNRRVIDNQRSDHANAAAQLLLNPRIDHAVLETSWCNVAKQGLGFDRCAALLLTDFPDADNISHALQKQKMLQQIQFVSDFVAHQGIVVLPAEQNFLPVHFKLAQRKIGYFSVASDHPLLHAYANQGASNIYLKNNLIILAQGQDKSAALSAEILLKLTPDAQKSVLAAVAAAWLSGIHAEDIQQALHNFRDWFIVEPIKQGSDL
jgi:hypothetical protein